MPFYDYKCSSCDHVFMKSLSIATRKEPLSNPCPSCDIEGEITQVLTSPLIVDPCRIGRMKPEAGFNEVLRNIKKGNPGSDFNIRD